MGVPGDLKQWHAIIVHQLRRAYELGVTMAYGTDADYALPGSTGSTRCFAFSDVGRSEHSSECNFESTHDEYSRTAWSR